MKFIAYISGENQNLAIEEIKALLKIIEGSIEKILDQVLIIDLKKDYIKFLKRRLAYTHSISTFITSSTLEKNKILYKVSKDNIGIDKKFTFAVRIKKIKNYGKNIDNLQLEREIGEIIRYKTHAKVNLSSPDILFQGFITNNTFLFGRLLTFIKRRNFDNRSPRKRPFFHPSALNSKVARAMINLAHLTSGNLFLDPFSGTGTLAFEGSILGIENIGIDLNKKMIYGSKKNLAFYKAFLSLLINADSFFPPIREKSLDAIVTDLPYGRSSSTFGRDLVCIYETMLANSIRLLKRDKILVIMHPERPSIDNVLKKYKKIKTIKHIRIKVHSQLTRVISILKLIS